jgi:AcrR family transcriptional regulator
MSIPVVSRVDAPGPAGEAPDTKERLLDAAERLFAERGFVGTSMRAVTQAASASVSAANYHFGSKESLLASVIRRRIGPINELRLAALTQLESVAGSGGPLLLEDVLEAFLRPSFEHLERAREEGHASFPRQVAARLYADPPEAVQALKAEVFGELNERFGLAFSRALPGVRASRVRLMQQLTIASLVHVLSGQLDEELATELAGEAGPNEKVYEPLLRAMVANAAAGARAFAAETPTSEAGP